MKLIIYRTNVILEGMTPKVKNLIDRVTRFKPNDSEWWSKVRSGAHDGVIHLMRHGSFPIGLLDDVIQMLEIYEIKYTIKDTRRYPRYQRI